MVKDELIREIDNRTSLGTAAAKIAVDAMLEVITETLKSGGTVIFRNFGTFAIRERKPKSVRNINTGVQYTIGATKRVVFQPGKELKNL